MVCQQSALSSAPLGLVFGGIAYRRFRCATPTVINIECLPALLTRAHKAELFGIKTSILSKRL